MKCKYCSSTLKLVSPASGKFHCSFCELEFDSFELALDSKRKIILDTDSNFYQYMTTKDLINLTVIELTNYLSLARKEKRRIYDKVYSLKNESDSIDKENLQHINRTIKVIQNLLIEKQGYFPKKIFESTILKEYERLEKNRKK